jgi:hypothetical protein
MRSPRNKKVLEQNYMAMGGGGGMSNRSGGQIQRQNVNSAKNTAAGRVGSSTNYQLPWKQQRKKNSQKERDRFVDETASMLLRQIGDVLPE